MILTTTGIPEGGSLLTIARLRPSGKIAEGVRTD